MNTDPASPAGRVSGRRLPRLPRRRLAAALAGLAAAGVVAGCSSSGSSGGIGSPNGPVVVNSSPSGPYHGDELGTTVRAPSTVLTDTSNQPYAISDHLAGHVTIVYFGYTNCPDQCPTIMADIASSLRGLPADQRSKVSVVFVTTDPARDTTSVLRTWLNRFDPSFIGLTGTDAQIHQAAATVGVTLDPPSPLPGGGYDVTHSTETFGFLPDGTAHVVWTSTMGPVDYIHDLPLLIQQATSGATAPGATGTPAPATTSTP